MIVQVTPDVAVDPGDVMAVYSVVKKHAVEIHLRSGPMLALSVDEDVALNSAVAHIVRKIRGEADPTAETPA